MRGSKPITCSRRIQAPFRLAERMMALEMIDRRLRGAPPRENSQGGPD
jgi:hypothetical protein